jgi:hypothetical protein
MTAATDPGESAYQLHRLTQKYAQQIPALTLRVNGPSYVHAEVYHPERLLRMNKSGDLVSVVALHGSGEVVGHCRFTGLRDSRLAGALQRWSCPSTAITIC